MEKTGKTDSILSIFRYLYGDISSFELKKFGLLSIVFLNLIGSYWLLRPLKDGVFFTIVGIEYLPYAKMSSFMVIIPLILIYSKLVDLYSRHNLIYIICGIYATLFGIGSICLQLPTIGLENTDSSPDRLLGWILYFGIESYGSICVALFWSFVTSSTNSTSAKKGYPMIVTGGQIGSIIGPSLATATEYLSIPTLFIIAVMEISLVISLTRYYMVKIGNEELATHTTVDPTEKKKTTGLLVGLKLLLTEKYLMGIFALSTIYEIVGTILDYQMKVLATEAHPTTESFTAFLGTFGVAVNTTSFCISLLGTSYLLRRFGLRICLLIFPIAVGVILMLVFMIPSLTVIFVSQVIFKGLSYAINNPSKEMLYIPTSPDVKFKVKSWIDMFGGRSAKALGGVIVAPLKGSTDLLLHVGTLIGLAWVLVWGFSALFVGKTWHRMTMEKELQASSLEAALEKK